MSRRLRSAEGVHIEVVCEPLDVVARIADKCDEIEQLLISKNAAYGNSALDPLRVFSKVDSVEQIKVRIDDKLSRLSRGKALPDETLRDTVNDLIGYLVLLCIAMDIGAPATKPAPTAQRTP